MAKGKRRAPAGARKSKARERPGGKTAASPGGPARTFLIAGIVLVLFVLVFLAGWALGRYLIS